MIDYEKLREAFILAQKYALLKDSHCRICAQFHNDCVVNFDIYGEPEIYTNIDDLIKKLESLVQPEQKYKHGAQVWYIDCTQSEGPICNATVTKTESVGWLWGEKRSFCELSSGLNIPEDVCYPTKAQLIEAQIEYWAKILQEDCEHPNKTDSGDCDDCGFIGEEGYVSPKFESEAKGFNCRHAWVFSSNANDHVCYHCNKTKKQLFHFNTDSIEKSEGVRDMDSKCQKKEATNPAFFTDVGADCRIPFPGEITAKGKDICKLVSDECQHESDAKNYFNPYYKHYMCKCIKCGDFYRG